MILYNMRYRGPYEYDKFILNTLQIANAINLTEINELKDNKEKLDSLIAIENIVNDAYNNYISVDNKKGLCEQVYEKTFYFKGAN